MSEKKTQRFSNPTSPRLLTIPKAAEYLGLTKWAMRERIWEGTTQYVQYQDDRKIHIDVSDLGALIEKDKQFF